MIVHVPSPTAFLEALGVDSAYPEELRNRRDGAATMIGDLKSSYAEHGYADLFYSLTRYLKPSLYLEFGVLSGYSLLSAGLAVSRNGAGRAVGVDLFEDYAFTRDYYSSVQSRIDLLNLGGACSLQRGSVYDVSPKDHHPDVLHIDISNDGDVVRHFFETWRDRVQKAILFEGGGMARDQVQWMLKYGKRPMQPLIEDIASSPGWRTYQVDAFPTFTIFIRA